MSDATFTLSQPNCDTPLAFLPPNHGYETALPVYVVAASAGILVWDVLDNVSGEFQLLFGRNTTLGTVAYFGSRIGALGYILGSAIFQTAPIGNCAAGETIPDIFYPISLSCSALLFFFRIRAIYNESRRITTLFAILWLGVMGCTMLIPLTVRGAHIGQTAYCQDANVPLFAYAALLAPLAYDTLVFIAISWRIAQNSHVTLNFRDGFKIVVLGRYLPAFTRAVLLDNQKYFLVIMVSNVVTVILAFNTSFPIPMRSMSSAPNMVLTNIMACRIYRNTRNGNMHLFDDALGEPQRRPVTPVTFGRMGRYSSDDMGNDSHELSTMTTDGPTGSDPQRDIECGVDVPESS